MPSARDRDDWLKSAHVESADTLRGNLTPTLVAEHTLRFLVQRTGAVVGALYLLDDTGALVLVGALNWGLIGIAKINLVMMLLGSWPMVERVVYVLVGLSAVAMLMAGKCCAKCDSCGASMDGEKKHEMGGGHKM